MTINALVEKLVTSTLRIRIPEHVRAHFERNGVKTSELRADVGLLDFSALFPQSLPVRLKSIQFSSIQSLLGEAERMFVQEANLAFIKVREFLERDVIGDISLALDTLDNELRVALPDGALRVALLGEILSAKAEFSHDLKLISTWFSAAEHGELGLGSLRDVIAMAYRVIKFASNGRIGHFKKAEFKDEDLSPDVGRLMYEVISILLRNVVQHSGIEIGQEVVCEHRIDDASHTLVMCNKIHNGLLCEELVKKAYATIEKPFDEWALGNAPGGTGFARIRKLLRQAKYNTVTFSFIKRIEPLRFEVQITYAP